MNERIVQFLLAITMILGQVGCAAITPPDTYHELKARMQTAPSEPRYAAAREQLRLAEAALADRDENAVARFSQMGIIETRIADAMGLHTELIKATEREVESLHQLRQELAVWRLKVDGALADHARLQMRRHIETVIDSETREAAAAEELQSHMGDTGEDVLQTARYHVAQELIAMARVRNAIVNMLVVRKALMPEQAQALDGSIALMQQALEDDDIGSVYRYGERNLALFTESIDGAWMLAGKDLADLSATACTALQKSFGEALVREDVGYAVALPLKSGDTANALNDLSRDVLELAAVALQNDKNLAVLVVVSGNGFPVRSQKRRDALISAIRAQLSGYQSDEGRFSVIDFSSERPLRALTGAGIRGALVFFPIP
ncbi:MAG: hypothetical protein JXX14_03415 [Deltaproteobacteria bacterium]|nr:hypothetical protein [Deltaproteobacteria bacterium]